MMEKINIAELLKDCPKGMELDCTMFNDVVFNTVEFGKTIIVTRTNGTDIHLDKYGTFSNGKDAKCVIFPKGKTTWEGFVPPCKFKIEKGKWYVCIQDLFDSYANKAFRKGDTYLSTQDGSLIPSNSNVPFEVVCASTYFRDWTINDAKDGDVLINKVYHGEFPFLFKETKPSDIKTDCLNPLTVLGYCGIGGTGFTKGEGWGDTANCTYYPAAKEHRDLLFQKIKEEGYKWNTRTKTLEDLVESKFKVGDRIIHKHNKSLGTIALIDESFYHCAFSVIPICDQDEWELVPTKFDVNTLIPFESKVLVRNDEGQYWIPAFWGCKRADGYTTTFGWCKYCIPYDGNEHLLETNKDCDEHFKTWK